MKLNPAFYHFDGSSPRLNGLPNRFCDDVIKYCLNKDDTIARIEGMDKASNEEIIKYQKARKSNLVWIDEQWIYRVIHPYVHDTICIGICGHDVNFLACVEGRLYDMMNLIVEVMSPVAHSSSPLSISLS